MSLARQGRTEQAQSLFDEAIALTDAQLPPRGSANPYKPAYELYGEFMLAQGQAERAIELFSESLLRTPNKSWSVLGLARSYVAQGLSDQAREQYQKLTQILVDDQLPGYQEALSYLAAGGG